MPGRRKTSLSRSTSQSRRKQDERAVETEEKREARLATDRARHAAARAQESAKQREARLASARTRQAASRAGESEEERAARLADDREYHAASRADETEEDRTARLSRVREYYAASRADETEEDRAARLSRDREYHAASRADETEEDRAARLSRDREYQAASRADETEEDRAARLSRGREYHAASRADETEEDRAARLSRDREYHAASRAHETEEDRAARLSRDREYHAASRADETEEDRAARLSRDREYHAASRADETEEDRAARLSRDREYHAASRADETEEDRAARLSRGREYHAASRADETEEDRAARLSRDREYHAASRADETEEDRAARLSTDRAHHSAARLAESQAERDTRRRSDRIRQAQRRSTLTEEEHSRILEARREDHARRQEQAQRQREERGQAVQGAVWSFITVYSIGLYGCNFDFPFEDNTKTTVMDLFYYSYFYGQCRYPDLGSLQYSNRIMNPHPQRTYILMITYGILSAVWIPSSILMLVIAVNRIHGKRGSRCYWPWILTTGLLNLLDIAASIIYIVDITRSLTTKDYAEYFHYYYSLKGVDGLTVVPAVLMTLLSCRAVIIWLVNLILFGVVIQASRALRRLSPAAAFVESDARMTPTTGYGKTSSWVHIRKNPSDPRMEPQEINLPRLSPQFGERRMERPTNLPLDGPARSQRPVLKPLAMGPPSSSPPPPPAGGKSFMINSPPPIVVPSPSSPFYDVYGKPTTPDSPQPSFVKTRNPQLDLNIKSEGINNNMPWSYMNPTQQQSRKAVPEPDYTIHPKRSSPHNSILPSGENKTPSLPKRPEGVNNKMPWSYVGPQQLPKPLPEPDYTVRQKRSPPRGSLGSEEGDVFQPSRRYENNPNVWKVM